eukprot:g18234.t1
MELKVEDGAVFLTPAKPFTDGAKERMYDFSILPTVTAMMKNKDHHSGRLMHTDKFCWHFSQLLNGREIESKLNNKESRDISYVVTAVEINRHRPLLPSNSFIFLLQFCQATRSSAWLGDVKEAFLLGLSFLESYGEDYFKDPSARVWMEVPKTIRGMSEFNFLELVELVKSIYGCKDAPKNWQKTLHQGLSTLQFKQSLIDPCLWCVFASPQEEELMKQGEEAVKEYYWKKIKEIDQLDKDDVQGAANIICGQDAQHLKSQVFTADNSSSTKDKQFINPMTEKLSTALTQHFQHPGHLLGAIGSHVDDTVSGGKLLYMLRIYALFRKFPLGSWSRLTPGGKDSFIGREIQVVPAAVDQHQMSEMLKSKEEEHEKHDIDVLENFLVPVDEEELQRTEKSMNITRDQPPNEYEKIKETACSAEVLAAGCRMQEEIVYIVSQENYAQKIQEITKEEVMNTGIELLAQRMLTSELVYALQIALDLHLVELGRPLLQLGDSKNLLSEPHEKSLRLDYHAISQLREDQILKLMHIPGKQNWTDALTKEPREVILLLLSCHVWILCARCCRTCYHVFDFEFYQAQFQHDDE